MTAPSPAPSDAGGHDHHHHQQDEADEATLDEAVMTGRRAVMAVAAAGPRITAGKTILSFGPALPPVLRRFRVLGGGGHDEGCLFREVHRVGGGGLPHFYFCLAGERFRRRGHTRGLRHVVNKALMWLQKGIAGGM